MSAARWAARRGPVGTVPKAVNRQLLCEHLFVFKLAFGSTDPFSLGVAPACEVRVSSGNVLGADSPNHPVVNARDEVHRGGDCTAERRALVRRRHSGEGGEHARCGQIHEGDPRDASPQKRRRAPHLSEPELVVQLVERQVLDQISDRLVLGALQGVLCIFEGS